MDCSGMGPLVSRLEQLAGSPFGGTPRVVVLHGTDGEPGQVNWTLGLTDLAGEALGHHHLHMPEEADVLHVTQRPRGGWAGRPGRVDRQP